VCVVCVLFLCSCVYEKLIERKRTEICSCVLCVCVDVVKLLLMLCCCVNLVDSCVCVRQTADFVFGLCSCVLEPRERDEIVNVCVCLDKVTRERVVCVFVFGVCVLCVCINLVFNG